MKWSNCLNNSMNKTLGCVAASAIVLVGCSGGTGDDIPPLSPPAYNEVDLAVEGAAVKGPIANGEVELFFMDLSMTDLKGDLLATANTNDQAQITNLNLPAEEIRQSDNIIDELFLLEVTGGVTAGTTTSPIIDTQRVFFNGGEIFDEQMIYATPLTTLALEMARLTYESMLELNSTLDAATAFENAFAEAEADIKTAFGFGLLSPSDGISFRTTAPIRSTDAALNYRTAIEGFAFIVESIRAAAALNGDSLDNNTLVALLADDLLDGVVDGQGLIGGELDGLAGLEALPPIVGSDSRLRDLVEADPASIIIPGTTMTLDMVNQLLVDEMSDIAPGEDPGSVQPAPSGLVAATGATGDTDLDGVPNALDAFYLNPDEHEDSDGDCGLVLTADQTPLTGDGCGDNSDDAPMDSGITSACDAGGSQFGTDGCNDDDMDSVVNYYDLFPNNADQSGDKDGDCATVLGYTNEDYLTATAGNDCGDAGEADLTICYDGGFFVHFTNSAVGSAGLDDADAGIRGTGENAPFPLTAELDTVEGIIRTEGLRPYMEVYVSGALAVRTSVDLDFELNVNDVASSHMSATNCVDFDLPAGGESVGCSSLLNDFSEDINDPNALVLQMNWQDGLAFIVPLTSREWYERPTPYLDSGLLERKFAMYSRTSGAGNYMGIDFLADPISGKRSSPWKCDYPYNPELDTLISR